MPTIPPITRRLAPVILGILPLLVATQEEEDAPRAAWQPDLAVAFEHASDQTRPLLVCLTDGGVLEQTALEDIYQHQDFVDLSDLMVCLVGCPMIHDEEVVQVGEVQRRVCSQYGPMSCADHQKLVEEVKALLDVEGPILPQHVLWMPDGTVLHRRAFPLEREDLLELMRRALHACGITTPADEREVVVPSERDQKRLVQAKLKEARKEGFSSRRIRILRDAWDIATPTIRDELLKYVESGDNDELRGEVIRLIRAPGEYTLLETFLKAAQNRREYVALAAVDGLRVLGLSEARPVLKKLLRKYAKGQPHGRVLHAYGACGIGDDDVLAAIVKDARSHDTGLKTYGLLAMRYAEPTDEVVEILGRAMRDQVTRVRAAAVWAVGMARMEECREQVADLLKVERGVDLKAMARRTLQRIDDPSAELDEEEPDGAVTQIGFEALIEDYVPLRDGRF